MAAIVPNYLDQDVIGDLRLDIIQIPASNTETLVSFNARMNSIIAAQAIAINNTTDADAHEATVIPSGNSITMTGVIAEIEYRIIAIGV